VFLIWQPKKLIFMAKKGFKFFPKIQDSDFCQKCDIFVRFFYRSSAKSRRTAKRPTVLCSLLNMLTIRINLRKINFLTNFRFFCKGVHRLFFLRKMSKIKNSQVWVPMNWKLNNELNEVWHSSFWLIFLIWRKIRIHILVKNTTTNTKNGAKKCMIQ